MKLLTIIYCVFLLNITARAQVSINNTGAAPSASSMLDVQSTSKGVKFPRMTSAQRKAVAVTSADAGLMLYDTDESSLYMYDGTQWLPFATASAKQQGIREREPSGISLNSKAGASVSMSGDVAAVGCSQDSVAGIQYAGSVLIYKKTGGTWLQQAKIVSPESEQEYFGYSVSILGNVLAVGAINARVAGIVQGAVYVYTNINGDWVFQQKLYANDGASGNQFGTAVLLHQGSLYVGSVNHKVSFSSQGSVYVFNSAGNSWTPLTRINGTEAGAGDHFGASLAAHNNTIVVGAPDDTNTSSGEGSAYVFLRTGNSFTQQAKLLFPGTTVPHMFLGRAVAIKNDLVLVGAPSADLSYASSPTGVVFGYKRNGSTWSYAFYIYPNMVEPGRKGFGQAISIANNSDIIVGAPYETVNGFTYKGAVYVYRMNAAVTYELFRYRYINTDPFPQTGTGTSIATSDTDMVIGSPGAPFVNVKGSVFFGTLY